jgi:hypothetical protein
MAHIKVVLQAQTNSVVRHLAFMLTPPALPSTRPLVPPGKADRP